MVVSISWKYGIFSFYEKDHGYRDNSSLKKFVTDILTKNSRILGFN